jgi:hypothetical protein
VVLETQSNIDLLFLPSKLSFLLSLLAPASGFKSRKDEGEEKGDRVKEDEVDNKEEEAEDDDDCEFSLK